MEFYLICVALTIAHSYNSFLVGCTLYLNNKGSIVSFFFLKRAKTQNKLIICLGDFPGGAVVKNPPANAGDMGSIPSPGRSHMPQSN